MSKFISCIRITITGLFVVACFMIIPVFVGCTKKPDSEDLAKLEEAKAAAESAERKLTELRSERMALEAQVQAKEMELQKIEAQRDDLKKGIGK